VRFPHSIIRKAVGMSFILFVALPIVLVWIFTTPLNSNEKHLTRGCIGLFAALILGSWLVRARFGKEPLQCLNWEGQYEIF
jgi:hypothetical protein